MPSNKRKYAMTHVQKGIWVTELKYPDTNMFNIGGSCTVERNLDIHRLNNAIERTIKETQCLQFILDEESPPNLIQSEATEVHIAFKDFSQNSDSKLEFKKWCQDCLSEPLNLKSRSYFFSTYKLNDSCYGFLIKVHHLVCDGVSMQNIIGRICTHYNLQSSKVPEFQPEDNQDYFLNLESKYLAGKQYQRDSEFWREYLNSDSESCNFILGNRTVSPRSERVVYDIPPSVSAKIQSTCSSLSCSESTFYYSAIALLLSRYTNSERVSFGMPLHGRKKSDLSKNSMTVSTLPTQIDVDESKSFSELIKLSIQQNNRFYRHQKYDYAELSSQNRTHTIPRELFDVSFNYANTDYDLLLGGSPLIVEDVSPGEQHYSLQFLFKTLRNENVTRIYCDYKTEEYSRAQIDEVVCYLQALLEQVCDEPDGQLLSIPNLKQDALQCIETASHNALSCPSTVVSSFVDVASENLDRIAVFEANQQFTYRELADKVRTVSAHLSIAGVTSGSRVAVFLPKSADQIAALLAVMSLGAAYIPLEKELPEERIKHILNDSECNLVVSCQEWETLLPSHVNWSDIVALTDSDILTNIDDNFVICQPKNLAYLIYTSGSTGMPKGTQVRHSELVNYCQWAAKQYYPDKSDVAAYFTPLTFDLTITSLFPPLLAGAAIKVYTEGENFILSEILHDGLATVVKCTPSHLRAMQHETVDNQCSIKRFVVGGENLKTSVARHAYAQFGGNVAIYNEYGPTETVVGCMIHQFDPNADIDVSVPIGKPIDNTQIYITDRYGRHCSAFMKGELVIAGNCVSAGYWKLPEMTQKSFVVDQFFPSQFAYYSGDLAWRTSDGNVVYAGRVDKQVKIRGHRIEIEEIETKLQAHNNVKAVVVLVDEFSEDEKVLKAFVVLYSGLKICVEELRDYLASSLLHYMIPQFILFVDEIPLTVNGKVDTSRLLSLPVDCLELHDEEKLSEIEYSVLEEFKRVLGDSEFSLYSNFYHAGGDSIKAIQLVTLLQKLGVTVTAKDILQLPTPKSLCHHLSRNVRQEEESIVSPLVFFPTPIIKWFSELGLPKKEVYHQMLTVSLPTDIKRDDLDSIFALLVESHPILNSYVCDDSLILKVKDSPWSGVHHLTIDSINNRADVAEALLHQSCWPESELFEAVLLEGREGVELMLLAHHLIIDGVSWRILLADLNTLVEQHIKNEELRLPKSNNNYSNWLDFLGSSINEISKEEKLYWENQINVPPLIYDKAYESNFPQIKQFNARIEVVDLSELNMICTRLKIRPNELFFSLFTYSIFKVFGKKEFIVELEGIGRSSKRSSIDLSRNMGWFTSIYPLKSCCHEELIEHLKTTKQSMRDVPDNGMNWQSLVNASDGEYRKRTAKLPRFNYLGDFSDGRHLGEVNINYIHPYVISHEDNIYSEMFDFNIYWEGECKVSVSYVEDYISLSKLEEIVDVMSSQLRLLTFVSEKEFIDYYVSSDFPTVSLTELELKKIFEELPLN
ncbi:amino acid adenylation domain-containing protein [Vibrio proteolyticus]